MFTKEENQAENPSLLKNLNPFNKDYKPRLNLEPRISTLSAKGENNKEDNKSSYRSSLELEDQKSVKVSESVSVGDKCKNERADKSAMQTFCADLVYEIIQNSNNGGQKANRIFTTTYVEKKKNQINFRVIKNREKESSINQMNTFSNEKTIKSGNDVNVECAHSINSNINLKSEENNSNSEVKINDNEISEQVAELCGPKIKLNIMKESYLDILLSK
jgi:hypothetical protein